MSSETSTTATDFYLVNLSGVDDSLIQSAFSQIGPIRRFTRRTNDRGEYGFVSFETPQNVQAVLSTMDQKQFGSQTISVRVSKTALNNNANSNRPPPHHRLGNRPPHQHIFNATSRVDMIEGPYQIHIFDIDPDRTKNWQWKQIKEFASIAVNKNGQPIRVRLCDVIPDSEHGVKASIHYENKQMMEEAFFYLNDHVRSVFGNQATMACYAHEDRKQHAFPGRSRVSNRPDTPPKKFIDSSDQKFEMQQPPPSGFAPMWNPMWMSMMMNPSMNLSMGSVPGPTTMTMAQKPIPMDISNGASSSSSTDLYQLLENIKKISPA
jgi:RNA recognition motif-containing protein